MRGSSSYRPRRACPTNASTRVASSATSGVAPQGDQGAQRHPPTPLDPREAQRGQPQSDRLAGDLEDREVLCEPLAQPEGGLARLKERVHQLVASSSPAAGVSAIASSAVPVS